MMNKIILGVFYFFFFFLIFKKSIRAKDNQISDKEWDKLTEHRKMAAQIKFKIQDLRKRPKHKIY